MQETPCVFCGNCVSVCPVGALSEKAGRFQGREGSLKRSCLSYWRRMCRSRCEITSLRSPNELTKQGMDVSGRFGSDYVLAGPHQKPLSGKTVPSSPSGMKPDTVANGLKRSNPRGLMHWRPCSAMHERGTSPQKLPVQRRPTTGSCAVWRSTVAGLVMALTER
jgi:ferredoxin